MSFPFLQKPISALKMALGEFVLPSVLPHDVDALKTLILAQQNAHAAVVQSMHQAMHQEAAANQCSCCSYLDHRSVLTRPNEARILQALLQQPEPVAAPAQNFDAVLSAVAKD